MKKYFLQIHLWRSSNKAAAEISEIAYAFHNTLVDGAKLKEIKLHLKAETKRVNEKFPRCTDMNLIVGERGGFQLLLIESNFQISVTEVTRELLSGEKRETATCPKCGSKNTTVVYAEYDTDCHDCGHNFKVES